MNEETFIQNFQVKAADFIDELSVSNKFDNTWYYIQLKEGVDKHQFGNSLIKFINENQTDDVFSIWVNAFGEDVSTQASEYPINYDYDDDTEHMEAADDEQLFTISVGEKTFEVLRENTEDSEYTIYDNQEYLGTLVPVPTESDAFKWETKSIIRGEPINISPEYAQRIGKAIEQADI